jgi:polysaccharide biosynthesis/export protein
MSLRWNDDEPAIDRSARRYAGVLMLAACCLASVPGVSSASGDEPRSYVVGPKDVLSVSVFNQPQLTGRYTVEADGMFTFPLLGRLKVSGLTLRALEDELRDRLAKGYLTDPQVTVTVEQYRSQQVFVMGEVRQPGGLQLSEPITLIEALARAGSVTERAGTEALILRASDGPGSLDPATIAQAGAAENAEVVRVNLQTLQTGALSENVALWPGDTVFVPRAEPVVVTGQVRSAGEYILRRSMTVRQVVALAGGITDRGSTRRIQILRLIDGVETIIPASMSDAVRPGDTIVVRERLF